MLIGGKQLNKDNSKNPNVILEYLSSILSPLIYSLILSNYIKFCQNIQGEDEQFSSLLAVLLDYPCKQYGAHEELLLLRHIKVWHLHL